MNCLSIVPQRPRYDQKKTLVFGLTVLKFAAVMDSTRPEDIGREFIISFRLVDDKMAVYETPVRNSGWPGIIIFIYYYSHPRHPTKMTGTSSTFVFMNRREVLGLHINSKTRVLER